MRHAYRSGAVSDEPPASGASSAGFPQDDTIPGARWAHSITSEIVNVIEDAGLTPDGTDLTQLRAAIALKIEAAVDGLVIPPGVSLATVAQHLVANPSAVLGATPAGLRAMLDALFGSASHRVFNTAGTHSYDWEWSATKGLAAFLNGAGCPPGRVSSRDIDLGTGSWVGAASDGTTVWFVDDTTNFARAYVASSSARIASRDIDLGAGFWGAAASDGTTLWFAELATDIARAYTAASRARDSARDIDLGGANATAGASDGTTLWFQVGNNARAYVAATRARDTNSDIMGPLGTQETIVSDGRTLWFVENTGRCAAYSTATQNRDDGRDFDIGQSGRNWSAAVHGGVALWFVDQNITTAHAYAASTPESVSVGGTDHDNDAVMTGLSAGDTFTLGIPAGGQVIIAPLF